MTIETINNGSSENVPKKKFKVGVEMECGGKDGTEIVDGDLWETVWVEAVSENEARNIVFNKTDFGNRRPTGFSEVEEIIADKKQEDDNLLTKEQKNMKQNFEQISIGPKLIHDEDLQHIIPLLRDHYQIDNPTQDNITPEIVQHVWDKLELHTDGRDNEGVKRQLAKEILDLKYSEVKVKSQEEQMTPEELKKEAMYQLGHAAHERHFRLDEYEVNKIVAGWELLDEEIKKLVLSSFPDVSMVLLDAKINKK